MVSTIFPGPQHTHYTEELGQRTCNLAVKFPVDMSKSIGNYIADVDGNVYAAAQPQPRAGVATVHAQLLTPA